MIFSFPEYKNMPAGWQFVAPPVKEAKITLQGPEQAFRLMNEDSLKLSLDVSALAQKNQEFSLNRNMVNTPNGLSIAEISPVKIKVSRRGRLPRICRSTSRPSTGCRITWSCRKYP